MTTKGEEIVICTKESVFKQTVLKADWYRCPSCRQFLITQLFKHCPNCGQKIKWIQI